MLKQDLIILRTQNYSESSLIINAVSNTGEYLSFMAKGARGKRKNRITPLLVPLSHCTVTYYPSKSGELHLLKEIESLDLKSLEYRNQEALCFKLFAAEILLKLCQQHNTHSDAFELCLWSIQFLKDAEQIIEFPLHFLRNFIFILGLQPESTVTELKSNESSEVNAAAVFGGYPKESDLANALANIVLANKQKEVVLKNGAHRLLALKNLLNYVNEQLPGFNRLKSLEVIREVLS